MAKGKKMSRKGRKLQQNRRNTTDVISRSQNGRLRGGQLITVVPRTMGLDKDGLAHAKLLLDPCNGPLTYPCYEGGCGGILTRSETTFTIGNLGSNTAGILHWVPGYNRGYTSASTNYCENLTYGPAANDTSGVVMGSAPYGQAPLPPFAVGVSRCVAACLQVYWPGSELNRQGFVSMGNTAGNTVITGSNVTPGQISQNCTTTDRVPDDYLEQVWVPMTGDELFVDGGLDVAEVAEDNTFNLEQLAQHAALTVTWSGLPTLTGLKFRFVAVYESTISNNVSTNQAMIVNMNKPRPSSNTLNDILRWLWDHGPNFAHKYGGAIASGIAAYNGAGYRGNAAIGFRR